MMAAVFLSVGMSDSAEATPSIPISLSSDGALDIFITSNGFDGDGSEGNPYLINNLEIDATGHANAITLSNIHKYLMIAECTLTNAGQAGIAMNDVSNVTIQGNTINNNGQRAVMLEHSNNVTMNANDCTNNPTDGFRIVYSSDISVFGNYITNSYDGIYLGVVQNSTFEINQFPLVDARGFFVVESDNNTFSDNSIIDSIHGLYIDGSDNNIIDGTICGFLGQQVIYLWQSNGNQVSNSTLAGTDYGAVIYLSESSRNTIFNNTVLDLSHMTMDGILLDASDDNIVSNNTVNGTYYGIHLLDSNGNTLVNNTYTNHVLSIMGTGIILGSSNDNTVLNNTVNNSYAGIVLSNSNVNNLVGNICQDIDGEGIGISDSHSNLIENNNCSYNAFNGIGISSSGGSSYGNIVTSNNCTGNGVMATGAGIYLSSSLAYSSTGNTISFNKCDGNNYYGIWILNSPGNTVASNTVHNNDGSGIYVQGSSETDVLSNIINANGDSGIWLDSSDHCNVEFNTAGQNTDGIYLSGSDRNVLNGNDLQGNMYGVFLEGSSYNSIRKNNCSDGVGADGIYLDSSNFNTLQNNIANDNIGYRGIFLRTSSSNTLRNNTCNGNSDGIYLYSTTLVFSVHNTIHNNTCNGNSVDGISLFGSSEHLSDTTITNNTCNDNRRGVIISSSSSCIIANNTCLSNEIGIWIKTSSNKNTVDRNNCSENSQAGVYLSSSNENTISNNTCEQNSQYGIYLSSSNNNRVFQNTCIADNPATGPSATVGIQLYGSDFNEVLRNICERNGVGLILQDSDHNNISFNELNHNNYFMGLRRNINMITSYNNNIANNSCLGSDYGISISGGEDNRIVGNDFSNNADKGIEIYNINYGKARFVIANNTCNGNAYGIWVQGPLYDSRIFNNTCSGNGVAGIHIEYRSYNNIISNNTLTNNGKGLIITGAGLNDCYGNTIANNTIEGNLAYGIDIAFSTGNRIFGNVLINNNGAMSEYDPAHVQAYDSGVNFWNDTTYGNRWGDWTSPDANGDGFVDDPYAIDGGTNQDHYPLAVSLMIISPIDGFATKGTSVELSGTATSFFGVSRVTWYNVVTGESGDCSGTDTWAATVPLVAGDNRIMVNMTDLGGSEVSVSVTVLLDDVDPTLVINSPAEGAYVGSSVTVTWTANGTGSDIDYYTVSIEGRFSNDTNDTSFTINGLADGQYSVLVTAHDIAGNYVDVPVTFTVDTVAPTLAIISPSANYLSTTSSIVLTWNGSDSGSGVDHYDVRWEGGSPISVNSSVSTFTFTGLSDGSHVLTVTIYDKAGLTTFDTVTVKVDTQPPSLTITSPATGAFVTDDDITVTWAGSDAGTGIAYYAVSMEGSFSINTTGSSYTINGLADGTYTVMVSAYDVLGNYRDEVVTFTVDTVAPTLSIVSPDEGDLFNGTTVTVTWTTSDTNPGTVQIRFDTESWAPAYEAQFVKTGLTNGPHTVYVKVTDAAGNYVEASVNFTVDTVAPIVSIISPTDGSYNSTGNVTVIWTGSDEGSGINRYEISPNGTSWTIVTGTEHTLALGDGNHTIRVRAYDKAGNFNETNVTVIVDTVAPTAIVSPTGDQAPLSPQVVVEFSEAMNQTSVTIVVEGVEGSVDWSGNTATLTLSGRLAYGTTYNVTASGKDLAGNTMTTNWTFSTLSVGSIVGVLLDDKGDPMAEILVQLSGGDSATTDSQGNFRFDQLLVGNYTLTVEVEGYEPLTMNVTVEADGTTDLGDIVLVSTDAGSDEGAFPWLMLIIGLGIVAAVAVVAVVYLKKK